jgi:hypothetical protein
VPPRCPRLAASHLAAAALAIALGPGLSGCKSEDKGTNNANVDPLPSANLYTPDEVRDQFFNWSIRPLRRSELGFSVLIPKSWREEPVLVTPTELSKDDQDLVVLARFVPDKDAEAGAIEIAYQRLNHEMVLGDFVDLYLKSHAIEVVRRQPGTFNKDQVDDVLVGVRARKPFLARLTFRKDGPHILVVQSSSSEEKYPDFAKPFGAAAVSFFLHPGSGKPYAEDFKSYLAPSPPGLTFRYPTSWNAEAIPDAPVGRGGVDVTLKSADGAVRAVLRVKWVMKSAAPDVTVPLLLEKASAEFDSIARIDTFLGKERVPGAGTPPNGDVSLYTASSGKSRLLLRAVGFEGKTAVYSVSLLGPSKDQDGEAWAAAARAFEIAALDVLQQTKRE